MPTDGLVSTILPAHILAGALALAFGYVALYASKGATLHRRSGMLFVYAMVTMSLSGAVMDAWKTRSITVNVVAGLMTFYFVATGLRRGRPEAAPSFIFGIVGLLAATGDIRVLRGRVMQGTRRIARHLWRLCFAMWVAAASFFWGRHAESPR